MANRRYGGFRVSVPSSTGKNFRAVEAGISGIRLGGFSPLFDGEKFSGCAASQTGFAAIMCFSPLFDGEKFSGRQEAIALRARTRFSPLFDGEKFSGRTGPCRTHH